FAQGIDGRDLVIVRSPVGKALVGETRAGEATRHLGVLAVGAGPAVDVVGGRAGGSRPLQRYLGVGGACGCGFPPTGMPLRVKLVGVAGLPGLAWKPKSTEAPGAMVPSQEALEMTYWLPCWLWICAFQILMIWNPA